MIETIKVGVIAVFLLAALFFTTASATGVIRLPDIYARAHTASQVDTLGAGFGLAAVVVALWPTPRTVLAALLLVFIFITNPTAAHAIARAAYEAGVEPWGRESLEEDQP